jgi:hypothetical protein
MKSVSIRLNWNIHISCPCKIFIQQNSRIASFRHYYHCNVVSGRCCLQTSGSSKCRPGIQVPWFGCWPVPLDADFDRLANVRGLVQRHLESGASSAAYCVIKKVWYDIFNFNVIFEGTCHSERLARIFRYIYGYEISLLRVQYMGAQGESDIFTSKYKVIKIP